MCFIYTKNVIHPTITFTINHTSPKNEAVEDRCNCEPQDSISFLDTSLSIQNGKIDTDLFKKETDRNQYLLRESCHTSSPSWTKQKTDITTHVWSLQHRCICGHNHICVVILTCVWTYPHTCGYTHICVVIHTGVWTCPHACGKDHTGACVGIITPVWVCSHS